MKHISVNTEKGMNFRVRYENSTNYNLYQCYERPSQNKIREEAICRATMIDTGGHNFKILSYNTFQFTCGWITAGGDLRIETANNTYLVHIPEHFEPTPEEVTESASKMMPEF